MSPTTVRYLAVFSLTLLVFSGCGAGGGPRANVKGKISYNGQPLPVGTITFVGEKVVASGQIINGEYAVPQAPVGPVKISVSTPAPVSAMQMNQKVEGKSFGGQDTNVVQVPSNYSNPDFSGLTYTVTKDSPQTYDIELK